MASVGWTSKAAMLSPVELFNIAIFDQGIPCFTVIIVLAVLHAESEFCGQFYWQSVA